MLEALKNLFSAKSNYPAFPRGIERNGMRQGDAYHREVEMRRHLSKHAPRAGFGTCACCQMPWWAVNGHSVSFSADGACSPVCEMCWRNLTPEELWPYYEAFLLRTYRGDTAKEKTLKNNFWNDFGLVFGSVWVR